MLRKLDHVAIAVPQAQEAAELFQSLLGLESLWSEYVPHESVNVHFLDAGSVKLELLEAAGPDSPVARFLESRKGRLHHLAFTVPDIDAEMRRLKQAGFTPLSQEPTLGAGGKRIFFLHPKETAGVLIELCQNPGKARALPHVLAVTPKAHATLAENLVRHAALLTVHSFDDACHSMHQDGVQLAHFLVVGGNPADALEYAQRKDGGCRTLALHLVDSYIPSGMLRCDAPLLISAPDVLAETAQSLHRACHGSRLCILPTLDQAPGQVDAIALTPVLLAHFGIAQR